MPNPYPATFEVAENLHVRLDGDVTFTDPANQPGGGGGGQVNSVTAGDASITIGGTVTDPTVAVAALGVTSGKIASNAVTQAKLAANAVGAAQMDSGAASANWVPVADGTGGVVYAASPGVNSLTAADTSIVVGGTSASPTVRTGTLDTIATQHPPTAAVALNSQKITGLANGTLASDAAAFGQIPTALPPNGSAGGDLSGTYPNPTVAAIEGVAVSATAPTANQVLTASDATHAAWATPSSSGSPPTRQIFTASGTYTKPTGCTAIIVECIGGGGAGGGTPATNASSPGTTAAAGSGRSGAYAASLITSPSSSYTVTIGAGGTGVSGAGGGNGSDTTFGSTIVVAGAGKGAPVAVKDIGTFPDTSGSLGGANNASTGNLQVGGGIGSPGFIFSATLPIGGAGGSSPKYCPSRNSGGSGGTFAGGAGLAYGGGGNGATAVASAAAQKGGDGAAGICIVTEFY